MPKIMQKAGHFLGTFSTHVYLKFTMQKVFQN